MRNHVWAFIIVIAAAACGPSFKNVKATAELGQALGKYPIVVEDWKAECKAGHAATPSNWKKICDNPDQEYQATVESAQAASLLLQEYAVSLQAAADNQDISTKESFNAVISQVETMNSDLVKKRIPQLGSLAEILSKDKKLVGKLTLAGVNTIVDTLAGFASRSYRRKGLAKAITEANPHVQNLLQVLAEEAKLHVVLLKIVQQDIATQLLLPPSVDEASPSNNPSTSIGYAVLATTRLQLLAQSSANARIASLKTFIATCNAFGEAHGKLAQRIAANQGWEDDELMKELKASIETIAGKVFP